MARFSPSSRVLDSKYKNWLTSGLYLIYLKEGLQSFIENEVHSMHTNIVRQLYGGPVKPLIRCSVCNSCFVNQNELTGIWELGSPCPNGICDKWLNKLLLLHTTPTSENIYWSNSDATAWPFDPWECAKVYMPKDQPASNTGSKESTVQALMTLVTNCKHFQSKLSLPGHVLANEAGIMNENLKIALEPETASIYCRLLPVEKMAEGAGVCSLKPGSKYMVLDAGGGTVDITVHEVMLGGELKELHKASGGAWGGTQVDEAYKQFLIGLVGNLVFQRFCKENKDDHLDMCRDFEVQKRDIAPDKDTTVTIRMPSSLKEIFQDETGEDLPDAFRKTGYAEKVSLMRDKLRIDASVMKDLFMKAIQETVSHLKELMKDTQLRGISSILMVGGFSESKMLQNAVRSEFPSLRIIVPQDAGLVVLKGAVVFGHSPSSIAQRVCKYTYGVGTTHEFDALKHDKSKIKQYDIGPRCEDIFEKHVEIGQVVTLYETQSQRTYFPTQNDQKTVLFPIYCSTKKSPMYTTDEGVMKIGKIRVDIRDMSVPLQKREFIVSMTFCGTEIEISAKEIRTGRITKVSVDFLG